MLRKCINWFESYSEADTPAFGYYYDDINLDFLIICKSRLKYTL